VSWFSELTGFVESADSVRANLAPKRNGRLDEVSRRSAGHLLRRVDDPTRRADVIRRLNSMADVPNGDRPDRLRAVFGLDVTESSNPRAGWTRAARAGENPVWEIRGKSP
jgi:hypothetical protein